MYYGCNSALKLGVWMLGD